MLLIRVLPPPVDPVLVPVPSEVLLLADEVHELGPAFLKSVLSKLEVIALRVAASVVREPIHVQFVDERREWLREEVQRLGQELDELLRFPHDERLAVFAPGHDIVRPRVAHDVVRVAGGKGGKGGAVESDGDICHARAHSRGFREI